MPRTLLIVSTLLLIGCPEATKHFRTSDGRRRSYQMHFPPEYDGETPLPLLVVFHGGGSSGENARESYGIDDVADAEGFVVVYPDGIGEKHLGKLYATWNGGFCCGEAVREGVDDLLFVDELLDRLLEKHAIDATRVYATGISNGGVMSANVACELPDRFAAVAPVASPGIPDWCSGAAPVPAIFFHGTEDHCARYEGGEVCGGCYSRFLEEAFDITTEGDDTFPCQSAEDQWRYWGQVNGCSEVSEVYLETADTTCLAWQACAEGQPAILCTVEGGGHTWPGAPEQCDTDKDWCRIFLDIVGPTSTATDATAIMWDLFEQHRL